MDIYPQIFEEGFGKLEKTWIDDQNRDLCDDRTCGEMVCEGLKIFIAYFRLDNVLKCA